jgi:hypothetical protein
MADAVSVGDRVWFFERKRYKSASVYITGRTFFTKKTIGKVIECDATWARIRVRGDIDRVIGVSVKRLNLL